MLQRAWKAQRVQRLRRRLAEAALFPLLGVVFRAWFWSVRRRVVYDRRGPLFEFIASGRPCIIALWHQDVFPLMFELFRYTPERYPAYFMVSHGRIGTGGTHLLNIWGIQCIAGSGSQAGIAAVNELAERVRARPRAVLLMADGSRGPACEARWGAVHLAGRSGLPILAVRAWGDHLTIMKRTWMRLALPRPAGRMVFLSAQPLYVAADADKPELERCRRELEARLNAMVGAAERYFTDGPQAVEAWGPRIEEIDEH